MKNRKPLIAITGASSGIGKAAAEKFSMEGHPLLLMARRVERMEALALPDCICKKVDVIQLKEVKEAIAEAEKKYGPVDCLVNNAGVLASGNFSTQSPQDWENMLNVNVKGVLNGMHAILPEMIKRQAGTIININSGGGKRPYPGSAVYCGTKYAVKAITETVRQEVAKDNVRLIGIFPGFVETEMTNPKYDEEGKKKFDKIREEIGKTMTPEDLVSAIWFAYNQPAYITIREIFMAPNGDP